MQQKVKYSIVIPAYSEALLIVDSLEKVSKYLKKDNLSYELTEVIVVVADSIDDTASLAASQAHLFSYFTVVEPGKKVGKGRDVRAGMLSAKGDYVLFMDADLATPLRHIMPAFNKLEKLGADLLIADRPLNKIHNSKSRRIKSVLSNLLIRLLATPGIKDTQCGFKVFKKDVAKKLFGPLETLAWGFDIEILVRARTNHYKIDTLSINDWFDPKEDKMGLVGESSLHALLSTLKELLLISFRRLNGHYKRNNN